MWHRHRRATAVHVGVFLALLLDAGKLPAQLRVVFYYVRAERGVAEPTRLLVEDAFRNAFALSEVLDCIDPGDVNAIFQKLGIPPQGCTRTECAAKLGAYLQARKSIYGAVSSTDGGQIAMRLHVIDVASRNPEFTTQIESTLAQVDLIQQTAGELVRAVETGLKYEPRIQSIQGNLATIDCGGLHGIRRQTAFDYEVVRRQQVGQNVEERVVGEARVENVGRRESTVRIHSTPGVQIRPDESGVVYVLRRRQGRDAIPPVIEHERLEMCQANCPLKLSVDASDQGSGLESVYLFFKTDADSLAEYQQLRMVNASGPRYEIEIPGSEVNGTKIMYYFEASDSAGNRTIKRDLNVFDYTARIVAEDREPPLISEPVTFVERADACQVLAKVSDDVGLGCVELYFRPSGAVAYDSLVLVDYGEGVYGGELLGRGDTLRVILEYYVVATDIDGKATILGTEENPCRVLLGEKDARPPEIKTLEARWLTRERVQIVVDATDNVAVKEVMIEYSVPGGPVRRQTLRQVGTNPFWEWARSFTGEVSSIQYRAIAEDISGNSTTTEWQVRKNNFIMSGLTRDRLPPRVLFHSTPRFCFLVDQEGERTTAPAWTRRFREWSTDVFYMPTAQCDDDQGVHFARIHYRSLGDSAFQEQTHYAVNNSIQALIPGRAWGIEYWIEIFDFNDRSCSVGSRAKTCLTEHPVVLRLPEGVRRFLKRKEQAKVEGVVP